MYKLIQISDCHLFSAPSKVGYAGISPYDSLQKILQQIKRLEPDSVIVTGDVSGDASPDSYQHFFTLWQQSGLQRPELVLPGNHDMNASWPSAWASFTQPKSIALNPKWRLHYLPTEFSGASGSLKTDSVQQLLQSIAATPGMHHLIALHHPLHVSQVWMDKHRLSNVELLLSGLEQHDGIKGIVHGHVHTHRIHYYNSIPVVACPSTCWQWGNTEQFSVTDDAPGFMLYQLADDGQLSFTPHYLTEAKA